MATSVFQEHFAGEKGFEALKGYIKDANDFCKEVGSIMQDRADAENQYAKSLLKLGGKLTKTANDSLGSLREAWLAVAYEMEQEADIHRQLGQALHEDITKGMKNLVDAHNKTRKTIENPVEKAHKVMMDKRSEEAKVKKNAHAAAKDREQVYEQLGAARLSSSSGSWGKAQGQKGKRTSGSSADKKEMQKLEKKIQQAEDTLRKVDREYILVSQNSESARQAWENTMNKATQQLQSLEEERVTQMKDFMGKYRNNMSLIESQLLQCCEKLKNLTFNLDIGGDIQTVAMARRAGQPYAEQILPDFYAEDNNNPMDNERRRQVLHNYFLFLQQEAEREKSSISGYHKVLNSSHPGTDTHKEAMIKLTNTTATVNYLEASLYKINCTLAQLKGGEPQPYRYATFIQRNKEKGFMTSKLMIPNSIALESTTMANTSTPAPVDGSPAAAARTASTGSPAGYPINVGIHIHHTGQEQQSFAYGQQQPVPGQAGASFSATGHQPPQQPMPGAVPTPYAGSPQGYPTHSAAATHTAPPPGGVPTPFAGTKGVDFSGPHHPVADDPPPSYQDVTQGNEVIVSNCRAVGDYVGESTDELSFQEGDLITVYKKHQDGWWYGELNGRRGLFPALCVKEYAPKV